MIIDPNNGLEPNAGSLRRKSDASSASGTEQNAPKSQSTTHSGRDNVNLSQEAHSLSRLAAKIHASPDIDAGRLAAIKQAISDGSFEVNSELIASKMLDQDDLLA